MKILTKLVLCTYLITLLSSCASLDLMKSVNTSAISIGMTKAEVQQTLKKKPIGTISARKDPRTNIIYEVVEYTEYDGPRKIESYWLYFVNDKLDRWEPASKYYQPEI